MASPPAKKRPHKSSSPNIAENPNLYQPGGLHPLHINDTLQIGRYKILLKLGFGSFSTVWIARDYLTSSYVSIKIIEGAGYKPQAIEHDISHRLKQGDIMHPGLQFVLMLIDEFVVDGPNGKHQCYVTRVAGSRLEKPKGATYRNLEQARVLVAQVFRAIQYIHSCGVVHGDLHTNNVLLQLKNFDHWTEEELYKCIGTPYREKVEMLDTSIPVEGRAPAYLVHPCDLATLSGHLLLDKILFIDFSTSFFFESIPAHIDTPPQCTPPEVLYKSCFSMAIDQWTLGYLLFEVCTGYCIFKVLFGRDNDILKDLVSMLGKPPQKFWQMWEERGRYFEEDGTFLTTAKGIPVIPCFLKARIVDITRLYTDFVPDESWNGDGFPTKELEDMYDLLRQIFVYEPSSRLSLEKCLEHPFLTV